ncbi:MAG: pirin family protein [Candidatus Melainabacteria bacterium]|nr:pirin family protein [Candidatus Melainabacteria bacterium]
MSVCYRPGQERGHTQWNWLDSWHTFSFGDYHDPAHHHFGVLRVINEDWIAPSQGFETHGHRDMEIITLVLEGALAHKDSLGNGSTIQPGDVQRMSAGTGILHSEYNPSPAEPVHLLQVWIYPDQKGLVPSYEQRSFTEPPQGAGWQLLVSPDAREDSVLIHQDVLLSRACLAADAPLTYTLPPHRSAWLQVTDGVLLLEETTLQAGDGLGLLAADEPRVLVLQAQAPGAMLFLFELPPSQ